MNRFFTYALCAVAAAFGGPAASADTAAIAAVDRPCASVTTLAGIETHKTSARLLLASLQSQRVASPALRLDPVQADMAAVRKEAAKVTSPGAMRLRQRAPAAPQVARARAQALDAVAAVAAYQGNDPRAMARLLSRVDRSADALYARMQVAGSGGTSAAETGAFKCNADRQECRQTCKDTKGKVCCCGCGVTFVACLVL